MRKIVYLLPIGIFSAGITGLIVWFLAFRLDDELAMALEVVLITLTGTLVIALGSVAVFSVLIWREAYLRQKARRRQEEKEADVLSIVSEQHGVFVREMNPSATWRPLHLNPATYQNGKQAEVTEVELSTWQTWQAHKAVRQPSQAMLPAPTPQEAEPLDLLTVFTQPTQSYAIIGGQQTGKTFQAQHIASYWVRQGIKPVVIGPKWDRGEWSSCMLLGGGGDFERVEWGITKIRQLVEKRHADPRGHKDHPIQPVFFDDWTPIVDAVPSARALVLEATTLYASVNVILYFILHSDTANAWGIDRKGAALKDNFIKLLIVPQYDQNGQVVRSLTRGYIRFAGESVDRPTKLFTTQPLMLGQAVEIKPVIEPDDIEAKVLQLLTEEKSNREISEAIWGPGKFGSFYNRKIEQIAQKYG